MEDKDKEILRKEWGNPASLSIAAIIIVLAVALVVYVGLGFMKMVKLSDVDAENSNAQRCLNAAYNQADEYYYSKNGRSIPRDKEYIVSYYVGDKGWVNEPCELIPDSEVNLFYTPTDKNEKAVVRFVKGKAVEAWHSRGQELTDDKLRPYSLDEQREAYSYLKGTKNVIGYYNAEQ